MNYNILESKIEFKNNQFSKITVLVDFSDKNSPKPFTDVRAICADTNLSSGFMIISPNSKLDQDLLQKVAAYGSEDSNRDKIFPNWINRCKP